MCILGHIKHLCVFTYWVSPAQNHLPETSHPLETLLPPSWPVPKVHHATETACHPHHQSMHRKTISYVTITVCSSLPKGLKAVDNATWTVLNMAMTYRPLKIVHALYNLSLPKFNPLSSLWEVVTDGVGQPTTSAPQSIWLKGLWWSCDRPSKPLVDYLLLLETKRDINTRIETEKDREWKWIALDREDWDMECMWG